MKRLLSCMLIVVMVLVGCQKPEKANPSSNKNSGEKEVEKSISGEKKERVSITILNQSEPEGEEGEDIFKAITENINTDIEYLTTQRENYANKLNIMLASGDELDIFHTGEAPNSSTVAKWVEQDIILPFNDYLDDYPNIKKRLTDFDDFKKITNGKYYMLPYSGKQADSPLVNTHMFYIRKDWLENLGLDMPTTIEEFYDVAYAFSHNDPDQNGKNDTLGYTQGGMYWLYGLYNVFNASEKRVSQVDGKWQPEVISDGMKEAIRFIKKMKDNGVLDPEFLVMKGDELLDKYSSGKAGIMFVNGDGFIGKVFDKYSAKYPDKDPKDAFAVMPIPKGKDGARLDGWADHWGGFYLVNSGDEKKIKASLDAIEYFLSEEAGMLKAYGVEGVHYKKEGDTYVRLNDIKTPVDIKDSGKRLVEGFAPDFQTEVDKQNIPNIEYRNQDKAYKKGILKANVLYYVKLDVDSSLKNQLKEIYREAFADLIMESTNFDNDWNKYKKEYLENGGEDYIKAINEALK